MADGDSTYLTPHSYPADCTITENELRAVRDEVTDETSPVGEYLDDEWPPTDSCGNVYPIYFTVDDLNSKGKLLDDHDTPYDPFAGNLEPRSGDDWTFCNAPLDKWRSRYPEIRYCGGVTPGSTYCNQHKNRESIMKSAEEHMQTGLFAQSVDHVYSKLNPWQRLVGWGTFESLMGESNFEFAVEYREKMFDFSEEPIVPDDADDDDVLHVKCGYPTDYVDPALSLYQAAMMGVQMLTVQPRIMAEDREEGEGMMESRTPEYADLTAPPNEHDPSPQEYKTLETWSEHHLNLPFSRLVKDRPRLLERGGVSTDPDDSEDDLDSDDIVLELHTDAEDVETTEGGTDPNEFEDNDYQSPSDEIVESATDD